MEVGQFESTYECDEQVVETQGLGPCIGVAIVFNNRVSMTHQSGPHATDELDGFLDEVCQRISFSDRQKIRPIVAGGLLPGGKISVGKDRKYVLSKLEEAGFGEPQIAWCPDNAESQSIVIDTHLGTAIVETDYANSPTQRQSLQF